MPGKGPCELALPHGEHTAEAAVAVSCVMHFNGVQVTSLQSELQPNVSPPGGDAGRYPVHEVKVRGGMVSVGGHVWEGHASWRRAHHYTRVG